MSEERDLSNQMDAITISREYGSGGGEIASRLARRLGWQLVDHAIVERVGTLNKEGFRIVLRDLPLSLLISVEHEQVKFGQRLSRCR
jgi:hypothetical protein